MCVGHMDKKSEDEEKSFILYTINVQYTQKIYTLDQGMKR